MRNESIDEIGDAYARGRLQALQDLIERLDRECGKRRAQLHDLTEEGARETESFPAEPMKGIIVKIRAAVAQEQLSGLIAASEVVVKMFSEEAPTRQESRPPTGKQVG